MKKLFLRSVAGSLRPLAVAAVAGAAAAGLLASGAVAAKPSHPKKGAHHAKKHHAKKKMKAKKVKTPLVVTVFSPGNGDMSGVEGAGFVVDLAIDASSPRYNNLLSSTAGYKPFFNDPSSPTFHPGPAPGAPGLVVLLSGTPDKPGTPFQGPNTNLAGLFQLNGVATVEGNKAEDWATWEVLKPNFATGPETLTVYVVSGTAPAVVPASGLKPISNVVKVHFDIAK